MIEFSCLTFVVHLMDQHYLLDRSRKMEFVKVGIKKENRKKIFFFLLMQINIIQSIQKITPLPSNQIERFLRKKITVDLKILIHIGYPIPLPWLRGRKGSPIIYLPIQIGLFYQNRETLQAMICLVSVLEKYTNFPITFYRILIKFNCHHKNV